MKKNFTLILLSFCTLLSTYAQVAKTVKNTAGQLAKTILATETATLTNLTITGTIDARDFKFMRDELPNLAELDISAATINTYIGTDGPDDYSFTTVYAANNIPACAFSSPNKGTWNEKLKQIKLPKNITVIGDWSFYQCRGIQSFEIPSSVVIIGSNSMQNMMLDSIFIPSSVTQIGTNAFYEFSGSIQVDANNSKYSSIDGVLFDKAGKLIIRCPVSKAGSYTIPSTVTQIGYAAFAECKELTAVNISPNVKLIEAVAFLRCTKLKSITFPTSLTTIQATAFNSCVSLENLSLPGSLNSIEANVFSSCINLKTVFIPSSVKTIGQNAFHCSSGIITVNENNPNYSSVDGDLYNKAKTILYHCSISKTEKFIVPSTVNTIDVYAFDGCQYITSIELPHSLVGINNGAFMNCKELLSIEIPSNVKTIGEDAFASCFKLASITIPSSVVSIGRTAFIQCTALESIYVYPIIPIDLTSSSEVFSLVNKATCVLYVPAGSIPAYRAAAQWQEFYNIIEIAPEVNNLTTTAGKLSSQIPAAVRDTLTTLTLKGTIDARDFKFMRDSLPVLAVLDMKDVTIAAYKGIGGTISSTSTDYPANEIPENSFYFQDTYKGKQSLTSVILPNSVASIGILSFSTCTNLNYIGFPTSLRKIRTSAFSSCEGLTGTLTIPSSVDTIQSTAFNGCKGLEAVSVPSSVRFIGGNAFLSCSGNITVDPNNAIYSSADGVLFNKTKTVLKQCPTSKKGNYTLPSSVLTLDDFAFAYCSNLTSITLNSSLSTLGDNAFFHCSGLREISLPNSITKISNVAFGGCIGLTSFTIPSTVKSTGMGAFLGCSGLTKITIPSSVTSIGASSFSYCSALSSIYANSILPVDLSSSPNTFDFVEKGTCTLYVPVGSVAAYKTAAQWKDFLNIVEIAPEVNNLTTTAGKLSSQIPAAARDTLTTLTLKGTIDARDFRFMRDSLPVLAALDIKDVTIAAYTGLKGTYLPATEYFNYPANEIPTSSFYEVDTYKGKQSLKSVVLPKSVTAIGTLAFSSCTNLNSITFPSSLKIIYASAFYSCNGLNGIISIPSTVEKINGAAFSKCKGVSAISIPSSVTLIEQSAFMSFNGNINVETNNPNYSSADGVLFNKNKTQLMQCPTSKIGSYVLPNTVLTLDKFAFAECSNLTSIGLNSSLTSLAEAVFYKCSGLKEIKIPSSVTSISPSAFNGCEGLTSITIPSSIISIESGAFILCTGLTSITIPSSVKSIGGSSFSNCIALKSIYANSVLPVDLSSSPNVFENVYKSTCILYVPYGSKAAYKTAAQWKDFLNIVEIAPEVNNLTTTAGKLSSQIPAATRDTLTTLTLKGTIDARDFRFMRDSLPVLAVLDIKDVTIAAYTGLGGPFSLNPTTYPANSVPFCSFYDYNLKLGKKSLRTIVLPISVTCISAIAFQDCSNLTTVVFPPSLSIIENGVFLDCFKLTGNLVIPSTVKKIDDGTFNNCISLSSVYIPSSVTFLGDWIFRYNKCEVNVDKNNPNYSSIDGALFNKSQTKMFYCPSNKIGTYRIPNSVSEIDRWTFAGCNQLDSISLPSTLITIGEATFFNCSELKSVTIPTTVISIGGSAWYVCTRLKSIYSSLNVPIDLTSSPNVFYGVNKTTCTLYVPYGSKHLYETADQWKDFTHIVESALTSTAGGLAAIIPAAMRDTLTTLTLKGTIDARDFKFMRDELPKLAVLDIKDVNVVAYSGTEGTMISQVSFDYPVNGIPVQAFWGKTSLAKVILPISHKTIQDFAFYDCTNLRSIDNTSFANSIGSFAFNNCKNLTSLTLPSSITRIENGTFYSCESLTSIAIPTSVVSIGLNAFMGCIKLTSITIPKSVNKIDKGVFGGCQGLTSVYLPSTIKSLGENAFISCSSLSRIDLPSTVDSIGSNAFSNCVGLVSIYANRNVPVDLISSPNVFFDVNKTTCTLYVPYGSKAAYQAADQWKDFLHIEEAPGLTLSATNVSAAGNGGTNTIDITSNTSWTASSNQTWLTLSPGTASNNGVLTLTSSANLTLTTRSATVTVSATGLASQTITVTQAAGTATLLVSANSVELAKEAGSNASITITSNTAWKAVADQTWLTLNPATATGNGSLKITATANPTMAIRSATVTLSGIGGATSQNIVVTQAAGLASVTVSATNVGLTKEEGSNAKVTVNANTSWTATSNQDWLTISPSVATTGNGMLTLTATANNASTSRNATVTISAEGVAEKTISVTQAANLILSVSSKEVSIGKEEGSTASADVTSNTTWTAGSNQYWLTVSPTVATTGNATLTFTANANTMATTRTATVFLSAPGTTTQSIKVTQTAGNASLSLSATTVNVGKDAGSYALVTVSSNTTWSSSSNQSWLTTSPNNATLGDGLLTLNFTANPTLSIRTATVTITGDGAKPQSLTVVQAAGTGSVLVSSTNVSIAKEQGSTASVFVTANVEWTAASNQSWLVVNPTVGSGNGILVFNADANPSGTARIALVSLVANGSTLQTITVTQVGAVLADYLRLSSTELSLSNIAGNSQSINVESNLNWTASSNQTWLTLNRTSGTGNGSLTFTATANPTILSRMAEVSVSAPGQNKQTITITQAAGNALLTVNQLNVTIAKDEGSSVAVDVVSNTSWTSSSNQSWLTISPQTATTGNGKLTLRSALNPTINTRTATVTLTATGATTQSITVIQAAGDATLTVMEETVSLSKEEGSKASVEIKSNSLWTASSDQAWLAVTLSGSGNGTLTFTAKANNGSDERMATVTVSAPGVSSKSIKVTQEGNPILLVSTNTVSVAKEEGSTASLAITSNTIWAAKSDQPWLTVNPEAGNGNGILIFRSQMNTTFSDRVATVILSAKGVKQTITVTQVAGTPILTTSSNALLLGKEASTKTTVDISSNTTWTAVSDQNWLSITPASSTTGNGKITFAVTANPTVNLRTATVTLSGTGVTSQTITVMQSAGDPVLTLSANNLDLDNDAGSKATVEVESNTTWVANTDQSWLSISPNMGNSGNAKVTLTALANPTINNRTATVTILATGVAPQVITLTQKAGAATLAVSSQLVKLIESEGNSSSLNITSNATWTATCDQSWLTLSATSGVGNGTLKLNAEANPTTADREAKVVFTVEGGLSETVVVTQLVGAGFLTLSANEIGFKATEENTATVDIMANIYWIATSDQAWLTLSPNEAVNGNSTITLTAEENTGLERTATVIVKSVIGNKTIVVTQEGHKVGLEKRELGMITVYPNPVANELHISGFKGKTTLQLFDMAGKNVFSSELSNQSVISMTKFRQGIYLLRITTENGITEQKIIKQ